MDTFLAIAFWVIQGIMAGLGVYVSLRPQPEHKHKLFIVAFVVLFAVGGGINVFQTVRNGRAQDALQKQLAKIQSNTEKPPSVQVNIPATSPPNIIVNPALPPSSSPVSRGSLALDRIFVRTPKIEAGQPISANVFLINNGTEAMYDLRSYYGIALADSANDKTDTEMEAAFRKERKRVYKTVAKNRHGEILGIHNEVWNTLNLPSLTEQQADAILHGKNRLYVFAWATWKDSPRDFEVCYWLQAPDAPEILQEKLVWHSCE
jgi:hypothetical protein